MHRQLIIYIALTLAALFAPQAQAAPRERCFAETGYCVSGVILDYWERNGGLPVFGYPIGPQQIESVEGAWIGPVQWFERDRLEDHTNEGKGVLAGRLGARWLEVTGRPWIQGSEAPGRPGGPCRFFQQTGYNICNLYFRVYWEQNGGLERFGYPITPAFEETVEGKTYLVQYFERRRMEYHPENAGTPYEVLLGLLGRDIFQQSGGACDLKVDDRTRAYMTLYRDKMGCPTVARELQAVSQTYEKGQMIWVPGNKISPPTIYVVVPNQQTGIVAWSKFTDTYREGEAVGGGEAPPAGRIAPARGFGKLWWNNPVLREALGWAMTSESAGKATLLEYSQHEGRLLNRQSMNSIDVFLPNGEYTQAAYGP